MGSPVQRLIEHQQDLNLSGDQVARLQQIDQALQTETQPLRQQLEQFRPARGQNGAGQDAQGQRPEPSEADREAMRQRMEQARPVMDQLRKANEAALQRALQVLTPEQRTQAQSLMPQRGERGERGQGGQGDRRGGQGGGQGWNRSGGTR
jgi:Spy/CpxP family protein refolding chaperone